MKTKSQQIKSLLKYYYSHQNYTVILLIICKISRFAIFSLHLAGISSILGAVNFIIRHLITIHIIILIFIQDVKNVVNKFRNDYFKQDQYERQFVRALFEMIFTNIGTNKFSSQTDRVRRLQIVKRNFYEKRNTFMNLLISILVKS